MLEGARQRSAANGDDEDGATSSLSRFVQRERACNYYTRVLLCVKEKKRKKEKEILNNIIEIHRKMHASFARTKKYFISTRQQRMYKLRYVIIRLRSPRSLYNVYYIRDVIKKKRGAKKIK